jgi:4-hydroxy-2-oxoheptanedioate aldolase
MLMRENLLKARLRRDEPVYGVLTSIYDPLVAEALGHLGFDCYMLDCEHGAGGPREAEHLVRACESVGLTPLARVRSPDPKLALRFLDAGVMGLMLPAVRDVADVQCLVAAVKYPPEGERGAAGVRANDFLLGAMGQAEYLRFANEQTLVLPQIETVAAVEHLDALLQVPGVDGFFVGPRDLSLSMGFPDGPAHDEVRAVIRDVFARVRAAGLFVGITAFTGEDARVWVDAGARLILNSVHTLLKSGATTFFQGARGSR